MNILELILNGVSIGMVLTVCIIFIKLFISAYFDEDKETTMNINRIGEANFEMFFMLPLTMFSMCYLTYNTMKRF